MNITLDIGVGYDAGGALPGHLRRDQDPAEHHAAVRVQLVPPVCALPTAGGVLVTSNRPT